MSTLRSNSQFLFVSPYRLFNDAAGRGLVDVKAAGNSLLHQRIVRDQAEGLVLCPHFLQALEHALQRPV